MFGRLCNATVLGGGDEDYSNPIQDRDGLSPAASLNEESELRAM